MRVLIVVGTRPNFIKVTQFKKIAAQRKSPVEFKIVHTGQHYDHNMSKIFFAQFSLVPDFYLDVSESNPAGQIGEIILKLNQLVQTQFRPDLIMVPGDVNSTLAGAVVANKNSIKLAHLESGLRSHDFDMPEEWNRILTDRLSDYHFVTESSGMEHLKDEKMRGEAFFVGNTMIDTLVAFQDKINESEVLSKLKISKKQYALITIHRPSNTDNREGLLKLLELLGVLSNDIKVVFPLHPRTRSKLKEFSLFERIKELHNLIITDPKGYFDFQKLIQESRYVITDSGGIQEETTFLGIPCVTVRENTERPVTIERGTNRLASFEVGIIKNLITGLEAQRNRSVVAPDFWDGKSTERIIDILENLND